MFPSTPGGIPTGCYVTEEDLDDKAASWMERVAPMGGQRFRLDLDNAALLVIDMQLHFLSPSSPEFTCGGVAVIDRVRALADLFRERGRPVIYTRHAHEPDGSDAGNLGWWWAGMIVEGTEGSKIHPSLTPREGDLVLRKRRYSAFVGTDLDIHLSGRGVRDLVITGVMTNLCCETTARDAFMRDYRVKFVADATGTASEEMQLATLTNVAFGFADVCLAEDIIQGRA